MASFLSQAQKTTIDSALDNLHDTFKITIYACVEKTEAVADNSQYNALYHSSNNQNVASYNKVLIKYPIQARVRYAPDQTEGILPTNLLDSKGKARIKVSSEDYEKVKIATKIEIRENYYIVDGDADIEGIFSDNYYTVYLKREN
jgi:hypothetical protein